MRSSQHHSPRGIPAWFRLMAMLLGILVHAHAFAGERVLFIGNSFTYGAGSAVRVHHPESVTDLNGEGTGGVPALFKSFCVQRGIEVEVALETKGGSGLDWHLEHKREVLTRQPWDKVVMHGYSTLDAARPGDPALLVRSTAQLSSALLHAHPQTRIYLMATWSRADQTYEPKGHWFGQPIERMALDVRAAYDLAALGAKGVQGVIPVGEAFSRAMLNGVADPNPYDGIAFGQVDLWTHDHYHASSYGYYLEALVIFGQLTGHDPLALGPQERSADELGLSREQARALQQVAHDQLVASGVRFGQP